MKEPDRRGPNAQPGSFCRPSRARPTWSNPVAPWFSTNRPVKNQGKADFPTFCALSRFKTSAFHNLLSSCMIQIKNHDDGRKPFPDFPGNSRILFFELPQRLVASKPEGRRRKPWRRRVKPSQGQSMRFLSTPEFTRPGPPKFNPFQGNSTHFNLKKEKIQCTCPLPVKNGSHGSRLNGLPLRTPGVLSRRVSLPCPL